ncbi:hypothetical protein VTN96DRAFT_7261 [Rasamsonia emersonii]
MQAPPHLIDNASEQNPNPPKTSQSSGGSAFDRRTPENLQAAVRKQGAAPCYRGGQVSDWAREAFAALRRGTNALKTETWALDSSPSLSGTQAANLPKGWDAVRRPLTSASPADSSLNLDDLTLTLAYSTERSPSPLTHVSIVITSSMSTFEPLVRSSLPRPIMLLWFP